jgi:glyoxylate utilization-related uncharacterized protein
MKTQNLTDLVHFDEEGARRETLAETEQLWSAVICLDRVQESGPMSDPVADALLVVVAGEVVIHVDSARARMKQWETVVAPAGSSVVVKNASTDPSVVLVVTAPPPADPGPDSPPQTA